MPHIPARAAAAFPVLAVVMVSTPRSAALATAIAEARSERRRGLPPLVLDPHPATPAAAANRGRRRGGVADE